MAREAYDKELNLYTLAHTASMAEKNTEKDQYKEYMCNQCGNTYHQVGYKIVEIPLPGASPTSKYSAVKEEHPTITQELVGPSNISEKEANSQVPRPTVIVKTKAPVFISTPTIPHPTTCNAETQIGPWNEQQIMNKWKKEYAIS